MGNMEIFALVLVVTMDVTIEMWDPVLRPCLYAITVQVHFVIIVGVQTTRQLLLAFASKFITPACKSCHNSWRAGGLRLLLHKQQGA